MTIAAKVVVSYLAFLAGLVAATLCGTWVLASSVSGDWWRIPAGFASVLIAAPGTLMFANTVAQAERGAK